MGTRGTGVYSRDFPPIPDIDVPADSLWLGPVAVGRTDSVKLRVANRGDGPLHVEVSRIDYDILYMWAPIHVVMVWYGIY